MVTQSLILCTIGLDSKLTMNWNRFGWIWLRFFHDIQKIYLLVLQKSKVIYPCLLFFQIGSWCSTQNIYVSYWGRDIHLKWFKFPVPNGFLKPFRSWSRDVFHKLIRYKNDESTWIGNFINFPIRLVTSKSSWLIFMTHFYDSL